MRLSRWRVFKLHSYLCLLLFELVNESWTVEYYKTLSHARFSPAQANDKCAGVKVVFSEVPSENEESYINTSTEIS